MDLRRGLVALGDSITRGQGGAPALGVHPQSWVQWLAEALELPLTNLAADGACAPDVLRDQVPRLRGPYDLATLHVGANDARSLAFDAATFEDAVERVLAALGEAAERTLVLTVPLGLGRPRAGADAATASAILRRVAAAHGALACGLEDFRGPRVLLPDAVHPTSAGMVAIAERAADALAGAGVVVARRPASLPHAQERTDPLARARFGAWWLRLLARDHARRAVQRRRYRRSPS
jgi:lysophospholipase L1-like esterase